MKSGIPLIMLCLAVIGGLVWYGLSRAPDWSGGKNAGRQKDRVVEAKVDVPDRAAVEAAELGGRPLKERVVAVGALAGKRDSDEARKVLLALLEREKHVEVRAKIVRALGENWRSDPEAITAVTRCQTPDEKDEVREAADEVLMDLGERGREAIPALKGLLGEEKHRLAALGTLGEMGPFADLAVKDIATFLESKRVVERREALRTLRRIGAASASVLGDGKSGISVCLRDRDAEVRAEAAKAIKRIGDGAKRPDVKKALAALRQDPDERVKRAADSAWAKLYENE